MPVDGDVEFFGELPGFSLLQEKQEPDRYDGCGEAGDKKGQGSLRFGHRS
jgi:hypothetical protein